MIDVEATPSEPTTRTSHVKDEWSVGETAFFEYHCHEGHDSCDAELWYRSRESVTVIDASSELYDPVDELDTLQKRSDEGMPRLYIARFADGFEHVVYEDELMTSEAGYNPHCTRGVRPSSDPTSRAGAE